MDRLTGLFSLYREKKITLEEYERLKKINGTRKNTVEKFLSYGKTVTEYNDEQLRVIFQGICNDVNIEPFLDNKYNSLQMLFIYSCLKIGYNYKLLTDNNYSDSTMERIFLYMNEFGEDKDLLEAIDYYVDEVRLRRYLSWVSKVKYIKKYNIDPNKPLKGQIKYGYKAFKKDMTCRGFQYKEGETYVHDGKPVCCKEGFHFCLDIKGCFHFYPKGNCVVHRVEILGDIDTRFVQGKLCTNKIKILERVHD